MTLQRGDRLPTLRVLIAEDSPTDAKLIALSLEAIGRPLELERVQTAEAMRAALEHRAWDLVLSDWSMPTFSALAALAIVREMRPELPFIIVSGTVGEEAAVDAVRAGAHDYVLKDRLVRLVPAVERELRERARREAHGESEAGRVAMLESALDGIVGMDSAGNITELNPAAEQMIGYSRAEVLGKSLAELMVPERHREAHRAGLAKYLATGDGQLVGKRIEVTAMRRDGTEFPIELAITRIGALSPPRFTGFLRDISERKRAELEKEHRETERKKVDAALRISEARFRRLWDAGIILITISDAARKIVDINEAGAHMLGYSREELLTGLVRWDELTPPEWKEADERARTQLAATGVASPWQKELTRKDGTRLPVLAGAAMLDDVQGIAIAIDLTEQKSVERALVERVRVTSLMADVGIAVTAGGALRDTLQRCTDAMVRHLGAAFARIWTMSEAGTVLELQASAGMYTHIDGGHARVPVGRFKIGLIAQERTPYLTNDLANDERLGDPEWARREGLQAFAGHPLLINGNVVGVMAMFSREPLTDVALKGLSSVADEISLRVRSKHMEDARATLEDQLRQSQKMEAVGRLAGGVAHDFNNMLSVILSYAELIIADLKPNDPLRSDVEQINTAATRAAGLTRQLLTFSRRSIIEAKVVDLNEVLVGMGKMLERILGEDVELQLVTPPSVGRVKVDPTHIEQVIVNLVVNARDAMPTGGKLTIETANVVLDEDYAAAHLPSQPGRHVMLAVSDTGVGMARETQARIFEPFFTTKGVGKGTGLGLSTVFGIVQQSGGNIWVYSEPGTGTTFKVYLPRVDDEVDVVRPAPAPATLRGTETVLLVEDEEQVRAIVLNILGRYGYRVLSAQSAGEALLLCEKHEGAIDLLLTDVVMPQMSGPELAKRIAAIRPEIKVLCMSGYTDDSVVRHGVLAAGVAFIQKPVTPASLAGKVREVLDH